MNVHGIAAEDIATPAFALRKGGLIRSLGAKLRGYGLAREPSAITMMEIVQALEGEAHLSARRCPPDWVWSVLETTVDETLQRVTLESLVNPP
jgi:DNA-binding IscR family transcriptional regulator